MNTQSTQQLPEQWQNALFAMRESIAQASAAMQLLAAAMNELRPLFESAEALQAEFSRYSFSPSGSGSTQPAMPVTRPGPGSPFSSAGAPFFSDGNGTEPQTESRPEPASTHAPEVLKPGAVELDGLEKYTLSFKADGPIDMMKVHTALEGIDEISGMSLSDYGPNSAQLEIWTASEPGSLPLVEALQDAFNEAPQVEPTPDGLLIKFGPRGS
jgi:hypothetical protein